MAGALRLTGVPARLGLIAYLLLWIFVPLDESTPNS